MCVHLQNLNDSLSDGFNTILICLYTTQKDPTVCIIMINSACVTALLLISAHKWNFISTALTGAIVYGDKDFCTSTSIERRTEAFSSTRLLEINHIWNRFHRLNDCSVMHMI